MSYCGQDSPRAAARCRTSPSSGQNTPWTRPGHAPTLTHTCTLKCVLLCCVCSKCGSFPPESCLFSLIGNVGAFMGKSRPRPLRLRLLTHSQRLLLHVISLPVLCSGDGVPAALRPGHRAQPALLGQHQCPGVRLHQRRGPGHGGQLPGERHCTSLRTCLTSRGYREDCKMSLDLNERITNLKSVHLVLMNITDTTTVE